MKTSLSNRNESVCSSKVRRSGFGRLGGLSVVFNYFRESTRLKKYQITNHTVQVLRRLGDIQLSDFSHSSNSSDSAFFLNSANSSDS